LFWAAEHDPYVYYFSRSFYDVKRFIFISKNFLSGEKPPPLLVEALRVVLVLLSSLTL